MLAQIQTLTVWKRTGRFLQLSDSKGNADHAPLVMEFLTQSWYDEEPPNPAPKWDLDKMMRAWMKGGVDYDEFIDLLDEWAARPQVVEDCRRYQASGDIGEYWMMLQNGIREVGLRFSESNLMQYDAERTRVPQ